MAKPTVTNEQRAAEMMRLHGDAILIALLAMVLSSFRSSRILFSGDELVTVSASTRPLPDLWEMLGVIDTHQGLYYLLMSIWHAIIPASEFTSRLSSALAVGIAAAGVVVLGKQVSTRTVAVTAGIAFAVLPRVTFAGADLRPYALSMAVAVWLTVFCISAAKAGDPRRWTIYGVLLVLATMTNLHLILIVPAHAVAVRLFGQHPKAIRYWAASVAGALLVLVPYAILIKSRFSGSWLPPLSGDTVRQVLTYQYFYAGPNLYRPILASVVTGVILVAGLVAGLRSSRRPSPLVALALTWVAAPTVILLVGSLFAPIYIPRYLSFTAPGFALLLGVCIVTVGRSRAGIAAVLVMFTIASTPAYLAQRDNPRVRNNQDYRAAAEVIDRAEPGDCLLVEDVNKRRWPPLRSALVVRPAVYDKLRDPGKVPSVSFFDYTNKTSAVTKKLADCPALWVISDADRSMPTRQQGVTLPPGPVLGESESYSVPAKLGFQIVERWQFGAIQVTKLTR